MSLRYEALCAILAVLVLIPGLAAGQLSSTVFCSVGRCPGATLFVPYFEVDLAAADGPTTLLTIGNVSEEAALARVVVWTNWGLPALGFDQWLEGHAIRSINLRDVFVHGRLPRSAADAAPSECGFPLARLGAEELASLRARLTGQSDPADGLCYSGAPRGADVATGYVTVDVMNKCSATPAYPGDEGYFEDGGTGLAGNRNVLWGELVLLEASTHRSEGMEAVAIRADAAAYGPDDDRFPVTFYAQPRSNRANLAIGYRTRFVNSTELDASTDLLIWTDGQPGARYPGLGGLECGAAPIGTVVHLGVRDEAASTGYEMIEFLTSLRTQRVSMDELEDMADRPFGTVDVLTKNRFSCGQLSPPTAYFQAWVVSVLKLRGRLSVGHPATPLERFSPICD